jgi:brefeldin A-inhibited guanine nucleotide-exchange protein
LVNGLLKTAQGVSPGVVSTLPPVQDETLKLEAMKCLVGVLRSMKDWMNKQLRITDAQHTQKTSETDEISENGFTTINGPKDASDETTEGTESRTESSNETSEAATFEQRRAHKIEMQVKLLEVDIIFYLQKTNLFNGHE